MKIKFKLKLNFYVCVDFLSYCTKQMVDMHMFKYTCDRYTNQPLIRLSLSTVCLEWMTDVEN